MKDRSMKFGCGTEPEDLKQGSSFGGRPNLEGERIAGQKGEADGLSMIFNYHVKTVSFKKIYTFLFHSLHPSSSRNGDRKSNRSA